MGRIIIKTKNYFDISFPILEGKDMVMPGEDISMNLKLNKQMSLKVGQQFTIRSNGLTIGSGKVSS